MTDDYDPQDPLPESNWLWRRVFIYSTMVVLLVGLGWIVWGMTDALLEIVKGDADATATVNALRDVAYYAIGFAAWLATIYTIAPSGEQVAKMVQAVKLSIGAPADASPVSRHKLSEEEIEDK